MENPTIKPLSSSSKGNCYLVKKGDSSLLVECGIPWPEIRKGVGFKTSALDGVLVTHEHKDHFMAVENALNSGVDVYLTKGTCTACAINDHHRVHIIEPLKTFSIGSWSILPFNVQHDAAEPVGFLIKHGADKILFATDTGTLDVWSPGITHLMIECNHSIKIMLENERKGLIDMARVKRVAASHLSLESVLDVLEENDTTSLKQIYLMHLSDSNSDAELFKKQVMAATGVPVFVC